MKIETVIFAIYVGILLPIMVITINEIGLIKYPLINIFVLFSYIVGPLHYPIWVSNIISDENRRWFISGHPGI